MHSITVKLNTIRYLPNSEKKVPSLTLSASPFPVNSGASKVIEAGTECPCFIFLTGSFLYLLFLIQPCFTFDDFCVVFCFKVLFPICKRDFSATQLEKSVKFKHSACYKTHVSLHKQVSHDKIFEN